MRAGIGLKPRLNLPQESAWKINLDLATTLPRYYTSVHGPTILPIAK